MSWGRPVGARWARCVARRRQPRPRDAGRRRRCHRQGRPAALVDGAQAACTLTPSASTLQLAETANVSHSTVAVSLERLRTRGWMRREQPAAGTLATTWRLVRPERIKDPPAHVDQVLDGLPPRPLTPAGGSARAHDAFARTVHAVSAGSPAGCSTPSTTAASRSGSSPP